ncbi:hypothetical protein NFI96_001205 [Prochilodus magdalenae]|nr:hypothetical protein NFI96_001205 [Prochilodus magdalenae]
MEDVISFREDPAFFNKIMPDHILQQSQHHGYVGEGSMATVHSKVFGAAAPLVVEAGEDLVLPCSLQPRISAVDMMVEWIRPDRTETSKLVHLYEDHKDKNTDQMESYRRRTSILKKDLQKGNTSLKLSAVQHSDEGVFKCLIRYRSWYDDVTVYVKVKDKISEKELSPAQCSVVAFMRVKSQYAREKLDLKRYKTSEEGYRRLIPAITNCRKACFADCNLSLSSIVTLSAALKTENSSLKELDLSNNDLKDSGVELLSAGLSSSHCKLEILRLSKCTFGEKSGELLGLVLQTETTSLKELDISNNELHDSGVELLSAGLKSSHCKLEILRLSKCTFGEKSCEHLGSVLQTETTCLKELDISNNELHDSGVEKLSAGLKSSHCKLEILRLSKCIFGEKSCENLGSVLQTETTSLKELDISNNELHDSGVEKLSAGLKGSHCKLEILSGQGYLPITLGSIQGGNEMGITEAIQNQNLYFTKLSGCMVREKGCSSLASALSFNPSHLKELDLTYNHPGESGVQLLSAKQEDPHCSLDILRVDHEGKITIRPKRYSCEVTLDPNTAHRELYLSDSNRKVAYVWRDQSYPDHPDRFDEWPQVLSRESLTGRCYWEAEWSGIVVHISVSYKSISRKGHSTDCRFGGNVKSWRLRCSNSRYSVLHNNISTAVSVPPSDCKRVGVYVDYLAGTLSFYRVSSDPHTLTHLHTFYTSFTEPLYAGFWVEKNSLVCLRE